MRTDTSAFCLHRFLLKLKRIVFFLLQKYLHEKERVIVCAQQLKPRLEHATVFINYNKELAGLFGFFLFGLCLVVVSYQLWLCACIVLSVYTFDFYFLCLYIYVLLSFTRERMLAEAAQLLAGWLVFAKAWSHK